MSDSVPVFFHRRLIPFEKFLFVRELTTRTALFCAMFIGIYSASAASTVDLTQAVVAIRGGDRPPAEVMAGRVLVEEVEKRTDLRWPVSSSWPQQKPVIAITTQTAETQWGRPVPTRQGPDLPETKSEGYRVFVDTTNSEYPVVWVIGADPRGALFGAGCLLRNLIWKKGSAHLPGNLDIATSPQYSIRGHQLGYRNKANTYDAFSVEQYEQYIRELVIFGTNCIENIPLSDKRKSPHMKLPRREMNQKLSDICARYGVDYWIWSPVEVDLADKALREKEFKTREQLYQYCPRIDAVFVPGGDPGNNHPKLLLPFLDELSNRLSRYHPSAKIWVSLQGFNKEEIDYFHSYVDKHLPEWLGGVVCGPSSPPVWETRKRLPKRYAIRDYPDITHSVRCQYPALWWDPAFALILGRECSNPRPNFYARVHRWTAPYTNGFLSYSEGVHDDVNKIVWNMLGWNPNTDLRDILIQYCRFFFGPDVEESASDGIFALEKNWEGPIVQNGSIETTLIHWQKLEKDFPQSPDNWRWNLCLLRAYYDAFIRLRYIREQKLEQEANQILAETSSRGVDGAIDGALKILQSVDEQPTRPDLRKRIEDLCESLFRTIGLQTSVKGYGGSGPQRGCVLDFIDRPLNNRWWLEDEFTRIRQMSSDAEKLARLEQIRTWENPGPGSFYDDIGNISKSPHLYRGELVRTGPPPRQLSTPTFWAWDGGFSRLRLSWLHTMRDPLGLRYIHLDPTANYILRLTGYGEAYPRVNGEPIQPSIYNKKDGEFKEFPIPQRLIQDGTIEVTFDIHDESRLNWRNQSRIAEAWLLKK